MSWVVLILIGVQWQSFDYAILLIAGITSFTAQLEQQARDYETDRLTERTFTTAVGLPVNQLLLKAGTIMLMIVTIISFGLQIIPLQYLPIALCAMPVGLRRFSQKAWNSQAQKLSYQMAVLAAVYLIGLLVFTQLF